MFTENVYERLGAQDPRKREDEYEDIEGLLRNVAKYTTGAPVVGLNRFQKPDVRNLAIQQDVERRTALAPEAAQLANTQDMRIASTANMLGDILQKYRNTQADLQQKQAQQLESIEQDTRHQLAALSRREKELDWELEKNQQKRNMAIENMYAKGMAEDTLLDMANAGTLRIQDIKAYFETLKNDMRNKFEDYKAERELDYQIAKYEAEAKARNTAAFIDGLIKVVGIGAKVLTGVFL